MKIFWVNYQNAENDYARTEDILEAIYYALTQPSRVNINDVYIMPTEQQ
jgi:NADP-dependent 3-hydroxy acid dehydrogenase YdfG